MTEIEKRPSHEEPFLIDPGSEDPGAGIDQLLPEPEPEPAPGDQRQTKDGQNQGADNAVRSAVPPVRR